MTKKKASLEKVTKQENNEFDLSLLNTDESIEDLGLPTAQPAPDDATPVCKQRILWSHNDPGDSGRSLEIRSLWHWTHGQIIPYGSGMMAACDEPGSRMTFLRLDGSRVTDKWFEIDDRVSDPFGRYRQCIWPRCFSCERIFLKRKGEDVYRLYNTNLEAVSQNTYVETAEYFVCDAAWARKADGTVVLVNKDGSETPVEKTYTRYMCFHGLAAPVSSSATKILYGEGLSGNMAERGCWGLINKQGQEILPPQFAYIGTLGKNLFIAVKDANQAPPEGRLISEGAEFYLYNDKGEQVLPVAYEGLLDISNLASSDGRLDDGVRFWAKKGGIWGVINQTGDELLPFVFCACPNMMARIAWNDLTVVKLMLDPQGEAYNDLEDILDVVTADSVLHHSVCFPHIDAVLNDQHIVVKDLEDGEEMRFVYYKGKIETAEELLRDDVYKQCVLTDSELAFLYKVDDRCCGHLYAGELTDLIDNWNCKPLQTTAASDGWHLIELNVKQA